MGRNIWPDSKINLYPMILKRKPIKRRIKMMITGMIRGRPGVFLLTMLIPYNEILADKNPMIRMVQAIQR